MGSIVCFHSERAAVGQAETSRFERGIADDTIELLCMHVVGSAREHASELMSALGRRRISESEVKCAEHWRLETEAQRASLRLSNLRRLTWGKALDCSKEIRGMNHAALLRTLARRAPLLRSLTRRQFVLWPRIATKQHQPSLRLSSSTRTMASIHIDDKVKALINNSYPQAQDAGDDPHKLSAIAFPHVEVSIGRIL